MKYVVKKRETHKKSINENKKILLAVRRLTAAEIAQLGER